MYVTTAIKIKLNSICSIYCHSELAVSCPLKVVATMSTCCTYQHEAGIGYLATAGQSWSWLLRQILSHFT